MVVGKPSQAETVRNVKVIAVDFAPYFLSRHVKAIPGEPTLQSAFELRYNVYCLECRFLDAGAYPEGLETDSYDEASAHFCSYNLKDELVGYVRLVSPDANGQFPWQQYCTELVDDVALPPNGQSAEISRLMVRQDYRRRVGDTLTGIAGADDSLPAPAERRTRSPQILLSLYRQMYHHSLENGIRYWYAAMERSLARSLQSMDFGFRKIGAQTDYFGPVAPYVADLRDLETRLEKSNPALLAWIQRPDRNNS